jgi:hypothetical protein
MELKIDIWKEKALCQMKAIAAPARVVQLSPDKCKALCDAAGVVYQPGYENRVLRRVTTTENPDRSGDIVRADGIDNSNFRKNPTVLFAHDHGNFPVGVSLSEKKFSDETGKGWTSDDLHLDNSVDPTGRSDLVHRMSLAGVLKGASIGFKPLAVKTDHTDKERAQMGLGQWGAEYLQIEKLEHSACSIPDNQDALSRTIKTLDLSIFCKEDLDIMEKFLQLEGNTIDLFAGALETKKIISIPAAEKGSSSSGNWGPADQNDAAQEVDNAIKDADEAKDADSHKTASDSHSKAHDAHKRMASDQDGLSKILHNDAAGAHKTASELHEKCSKEYTDENSKCAKCASFEAKGISKCAFKASKEPDDKSIQPTINNIIDVEKLATDLKAFLAPSEAPTKTKGEAYHEKLALQFDLTKKQNKAEPVLRFNIN